MRLLALACACAACSAVDAVPSDGGHDSSHPHDASAQDASVEASTATGPSVSGVVTDAQFVPWSGAKVQVCSTSLCTLGTADAAGVFSVHVPAGARYHVLAHPPPNDPREGSAGVAVLEDALVADVVLPAPITIPITGASESLPVASVTSDLTLAASASDIAFTGEAYFSGVSSTFAGGAVLGAWALNPWGTRANAGKTIAVTITNHFGLAPSDVVSVYALDESTAELVGPSAAVVSSDGLTIAGATVDRVTRIVLTKLN